jgi:malate permease and related proteins
MYGQFFVLFAIVFTGYFFRKFNIIDDAMNHGLNRFIVYFAYPCMIVHNIGTLDMSGQLMRSFLITFGISCGMFALYSIYSYLYCRVRKFPASSNVAEMAMSSPNNGFMGFPVALIFFGEQGLLLMLAHNAAMNFYFFSYGLLLLRRNAENRPKTTVCGVLRGFFKVLVNPNILALFIGFAIALFGIELEGTAIDTYLTSIGNVATPMAMIFIGSSLTGSSFADIIRDRPVVETSFNRLVLVPVLTYLVTILLPVDSLMKSIIVLGSCFPVAATVSMLAEQEGQDQELSSRALFLSTVVSMASIPASISLINILI